VDRLQAAAAAAAWLESYPGVSARARNARLVDARLIFVPIWEHKALAAGWEFGYKVRTRNELVQDPADEERVRFELQIVRQGVKESRLQERRFYQAAADFEAIGATRPRVTGRELLMPLLAGELDADATVLTAEGSAVEIAEKARRAALQPLSGAYVPDSHVFVFRESMALLYYPLWVVCYDEGGRPFRVVVNGRDGSVNSAVTPAARGRQITVLVAQLAAFVLVVSVLVFLAATRETGRIAMIVAAAIVSLAAVIFAGRYRTRREVEYHEPFSS